ncbi:hypothetical protein [Endozoicomonas sp. Mp262]|uniref:hypothetical protein n=1 Tax=Endozoicomonas sp. Mp262 TaxID=2919499 RepID=UPI0021D90C3F
MKKQIADELLSLIGQLEYLPDREALAIIKTAKGYVSKKVYTTDRAWGKRGIKNNG